LELLDTEPWLKLKQRKKTIAISLVGLELVIPQPERIGPVQLPLVGNFLISLFGDNPNMCFLNINTPKQSGTNL